MGRNHDISREARYEEKYISMLKGIVLANIGQERVAAFLFGSRVSGRAGMRADFDIGLWSDTGLNRKIYHGIRNDVDDSIIPYKVDIVDFTRVDDKFRSVALKEIEIWHLPEGMSINSVR